MSASIEITVAQGPEYTSLTSSVALEWNINRCTSCAMATESPQSLTSWIASDSSLQLRT